MRQKAQARDALARFRTRSLRPGEPFAAGSALEQAQQLVRGGDLSIPGQDWPPPGIWEADRIRARSLIQAASAADAHEVAADRSVLVAATAEDKIALIRKMTAGPLVQHEHNVRAALGVLASARSWAEYAQIVDAFGGAQGLGARFAADGARQALDRLDADWNGKQAAAAARAVALLEQARSPVEATELAETLGGAALRHQIRDPALLARLAEVARRHALPELG